MSFNQFLKSIFKREQQKPPDPKVKEGKKGKNDPNDQEDCAEPKRKKKIPCGSFDPLSDFFFKFSRIIIFILFFIGFVFSFYILIVYPEHPFKGIGLLFSTIWATIFLSYFRWAMFYYNINYGKSKKYWDKVFEIRDRRLAGEHVADWGPPPPEKNPHTNETFGFPRGTVRGMIAFTLLFGAISMLIVSFGMEGEMDESTFFWDHYEFFKTAFLMMIAFYFGYHSLKYLQSRWPQNLRKKSAGGETGDADTSNPETGETDETELYPKKAGNVSSLMKEVTEESPSLVRRAIASSEGTEDQFKLVPIIDAGHGGMIDGKYTTGNKKQYTFTNLPGGKKLTIYEGVINRQIGRKLTDLLDEANIPYKDLTVTSNEDVPLGERTSKANEIFSRNPNYYYLSIHSNSASATIKGEGTTARGFEIYTSVGQTKSDALATIAANWYKADFPEFRFRQEMEDDDPDKERDFWVLRKTNCPAFLVENLFFDNIREAEFLMSENGQNRIAKCLFKTVSDIYNNQA